MDAVKVCCLDIQLLFPTKIVFNTPMLVYSGLIYSVENPPSPSLFFLSRQVQELQFLR